jgi:4-carboxymuconolactone decarboxylase
MTESGRIPLIDSSSTPEMPALFARIASARGGQVPNLYRALANSPTVCSAWLELFTQLRQAPVVPPLLRETAMLRIAVLNRAEYEFVSHTPHARAAGVSDAQLSALRQPVLDLGAFSEAQGAVLCYTDAMTKNVQVPDPVFEGIRRIFGAQGILEMTVIVAGYNMVSRVLEALAIPHDA